ncbi:Thoeris anti-defense Tad2 family protein [Xenorhabdus bovienii]|uniref:Thoeris anti-defense Tad2 family protein n=1 Tax=Xenorhabdus bovienii TaxID=40576 RepID=UPI0023B21061|nr:MW1434 family type I TA system toxin [Xenorhabdus bovienii]MDE9462934.1 DUF2829 domain-containing protein [Xenorhabdus bovienii]MDE9470802.1 DUF2829 domain-containing protein [Xenorhabdus bovienii]MDE9540351.1 DUF2829 domain-containing protein [Xenorhabdus bovienii]
MSEVNKPENKESDLKCPFNPDEYKSDNVVAPVGSFPWAVIQVYLGNKVHRNDWDSPNEYIHLTPESAPDSGGNNLPQIEKRDKHGYLASWQPTQEDMMACDWKLLKPLALEDHMMVFDLTLGTDLYSNSREPSWGYIAENVDITGLGTLNVIQNKTDIAKILFFCRHSFRNYAGGPDIDASMDFQVSSDENKDSYQKMIELFNKNFYVTVDDVTYNIGVPTSDSEEDIFAYTYMINYPQSSDKEKLKTILQQTGKTKRFYFNWR